MTLTPSGAGRDTPEVTLHLGLNRNASPALLCLGPIIGACGSRWDTLNPHLSARERRAAPWAVGTLAESWTPGGGRSAEQRGVD